LTAIPYIREKKFVNEQFLKEKSYLFFKVRLIARSYLFFPVFLIVRTVLFFTVCSIFLLYLG